jgi:hypothetical protein
MKTPVSAVNGVVEMLLRTESRVAVKYLGPQLVVRATRRLYNGKIARGIAPIEIALHIGRPNYIERRFIKACKQAGEPLPVRKIQITPLKRRS